MIRRSRRSLLLTTALAGTLLHGAARAADLPVAPDPMPAGLTYDGATIPTSTRLDVDLNNTNRIINWTSFDVGAGKVVNFTTPDTATRYSVLNRVAAGDPSDILGMITTTTLVDAATNTYAPNNIAVWLANPSGITFGATGSFSGGALVLTTAAISDTAWTAALAAADPAALVPLTGAPVPMTDAMTGITTGAITLAAGSTITTSGGMAAAAQSVTAGGRISAGGEVALIAATDLALPIGVGSPLGVRIDKGTKVGRVTAAGTAQIDAAVVRLAGASTDGQSAYLLQVDDGATLTATAVNGKVVLAAGVASDGVTLGATPADVSGAASIQYDGKTSATQPGGSAALGASGDIVTTTANGTINSTGAIGINASGNATIGAALGSTGGDVTVASSGATAVRSAVSAGGAYQATGASVTLGTAGTATTQAAQGAVTITATGGTLVGLDGLTLQSGSAGADAALGLSQAGTGGIAFAPGTELIGGTFAAGPPATYGFGADIVVTAIAGMQPLTLGNVHARALTVPALAGGGDITAGDIVVDAGLTLATPDAAGSIRLRSATSRTGGIALTAGGDVTGLVRTAAATDGRLIAGFDRADLTAQAATGTIAVKAATGTAQFGTITAGSGTTALAGDQAAVDAQAIDVASATANNGALRLTSTAGEVRIGSGTGGADAAVTAATSARIGSLTARTGSASAIATNGDLTGLVLPAAATDGRLVPAYDRANLAAQAAAGTVVAKAAAGTAQLGTVAAGSGTTALAGDQAAIDARAIDATVATTLNGALRLTSTAGEVRLVTGTGGTDATVAAATNARIGSLIATTGDASATATAGDVTGLALATPAADGRPIAGYDRANLAALGTIRAVTVKATAGTAQLGTISAGTGVSLSPGEQIGVDARAIDVTSATSVNGALRLVSTIGDVRLGGGAAGTDAVVGAAANARVGGIVTRTGAITISAANGDATGLALPTAATDSRPEAGYGLTTLNAGNSIRVGATDDVQLGAIRAVADIDVDAHPAAPAAAAADNVAWLGGTVTALAGHYRVTGGSVVLGAPGGIGQSAGGDLIVRSLAGDIAGGDGLALASGGSDTSAANPLILYSAGAIALPANGTITAGSGQYADIGLAAPAGSAITLGTASARRIGTAILDASQPTGYRIDQRLASPNPIAARKLTTVADLVIDTSGNGTAADLVLDEAQSTAGGINLATIGDVRGRLLSGAPAVYQRTRLTAFDGVVVTSGLALLDTVTAGTGVDIAAARIDALGIAGNAGDVVLRSSGDMRIDGVVAHGNGGDGLAALLADPTIALSAYATPAAIRTAGDIFATSSGDITGTPTSAPGATLQTFGLATFTATDGAVTLVSDATGAGKGLLALNAVTASGATAGHGDARLTGREIDVATGIVSTAGNVSVTARELGSQTQVGATIARATAAQNVAIDIGYGTAPGGGADDGSLRIGMVLTTNGTVQINARDGSVTGLAGTTDGLDPAHARAAVSAGGDVGIVAGRLVQLGELGGRDVTIAGGDDVQANVAQQGAIAHQDGAIDISHVAARGALTLTAAHGAVADGVSGIRLGALASGLADGGAASQAGAGATLRTLGTLGDVVIADGLTAQTDLLVASVASIRASTLTSAAGGIALTAGSGDVTGLVLPAAAGDGRMATGYGRADLTTLAAAQPITVMAANGIVQLGTATAGTGTGTAISEQLAVDAKSIDVVDATAANGALRLTSTAGEGRLAIGSAGTDATIGAATNARLGMLTTRSGSIAVTATTGDVSGLVLPAAATDGRIIPAYDRAILTSLAAGSSIAVKAAAGVAQLGPITAGTGDATAATGGIAVDARAIDVVNANAVNAALRLTSTAGEVRLAAGNAGTDAAIGAAGSARIGTLVARTGSIAVAATGGDVTGLALSPAAADGRMVPDYDRAVLTAQAAGTGVTVAASGTAQLDAVTAGAGNGLAATGGIAVTAGAIDLLAADARNAGLRLTATTGEARLATGNAATDATILAANNARIGALTSRTGSIAVTATAGDVTGLVLPMPASDGRLVPGYGRADLTVLAAGQAVAAKAPAGRVQLGTVSAGAGPDAAPGEAVAVDAQAIDIAAATAQNGALRLTSTAGEVRLAAGTAGTDATIRAATSARLGTLTARTGSIGVTAISGDVTGLAIAPAASDGRLVPGYDRAVLTAQAAATNVTVAAAGAAQLGTVRAGSGAGTATGGGIAVTARAIDLTDANALNAALRLTSTGGETRLATGTAGTDATILAANNARIGTLTARTGAVAVTAAAGDVTGLALAADAADGRLAAGYGRADLTAQAAGRTIAVTAAAGAAQLGTVTAGADATTSSGNQIVVDARTIDVMSATAQNGALRLTSTAGEARLAAGTAGTDAAIGAASNARIGTLAARTGSIAVTATTGDATGLALAAPATDGRMAPGYGRADLAAQAFATNVAVTAAGTAQLGTVSAGTGDATVTTGGIGVTANAIDLATADARNAALRLTSTGGETRLATGTAGTDAIVLAATNARIASLAARTGSIGVTATAGDVTGLVLPAAAGDGRLLPAYDRARLTAQAAGSGIAVTAAAGNAQLGPIAAGSGDATATTGGIAVDARAIDVATATAQNATLRLTASVGEARLAAGTAGTDATIGTATNARIGTLATRTGSIAIAAGGDATGLALAPTAAADGRLVADYGRADLTAQAAARNVTVTAGGAAQFGTVAAGTGTTTAPSGGIAVTAGAIDIATANAQNAALKLSSTRGETRLGTGTAATDATLLAATSARIGTLATRTGSIAVTATAGDVTGLAGGAGYGRADLTALAASKTIAVTAAAGTAQLGTVSAGTGTGSAGEQVAVDARAIDVAAATASDGALRLAATAGEARLVTGTAATDATIRAATSARIGDLTARTGAIVVTATAGDVTGVATTVSATDTRPLPNFGRANLTAPSATKSVTVTAAAGTAQLGTVAAGPDALAGGGGIAVTARAIDASAANARNGALALTATADRLYLGSGVAATTATLDKQGSADELHVTGTLAATGNATLASGTDIDLPVTPAVISSGGTLTLRNSGANATLLGSAATGTGFTLTEAEVNSLKAPKLTIDSRANNATIGNLAIAAAAGSGEVDLLGTGGFTLRGTIANSGGAARTLQLGGATASADAPNEAAIEAGTTIARSIVGELDNNAAINWTGGTLDLRAGTILFGNQALRTAAVGTPEGIAVNLVAASNSPLYIGALGTSLQNKVFLTALKLKVSYTGYALFQNTNLPAVPAGVVIGPQDRSVTNLALQLFSTGETPANSFALFGTINGFEGRTAGVLPADVVDYADVNPRLVRITQSNSRINGCVIGSPDKGCLVTDTPPLNFQLFDERQILLFGTADDAGLTFDPLIGTNNESLIGDIDSASLGINSIDCSAPGTRDCPATGEKQ